MRFAAATPAAGFTAAGQQVCSSAVASLWQGSSKFTAARQQVCTYTASSLKQRGSWQQHQQQVLQQRGSKFALTQ